MIRYYTSCGDSTATTGTGTFTLTGSAPTGCRSITSTLTDGDVVYYRVQTTDGVTWEDIKGTYTASGTTLSRTTTLASSNGGSAVSFGTGTKYIYIINPAETLSAQVLTTAGDILYSDGTTPARLGIGSTGDVLTVASGVPSWKSKAYYSANPTNPTAVSGSVMLGLAGSITPTSTGRILVTITGDVADGSPDYNAIISTIAYGAGTAPTNGAAATGTNAGAGQETRDYNGSALPYPVSVTAIMTGLSVGTAYWIDLRHDGANTLDTYTRLTISVIEF